MVAERVQVQEVGHVDVLQAELVRFGREVVRVTRCVVVNLKIIHALEYTTIYTVSAFELLALNSSKADLMLYHLESINGTEKTSSDTKHS